MSASGGERNLEEGLSNDSVSFTVKHALICNKFQKNLVTCGKGVVDVSHTVINAFSIVKTVAAGSHNLFNNPQNIYAEPPVGTISRPWGSDATLAVAPRKLVIPQ